MGWLCDVEYPSASLQQTSVCLSASLAIDDVHKVAGRIAKEEAPDAPFLGDRPVNDLGVRSSNSGLCGVQIVNAD